MSSTFMVQNSKFDLKPKRHHGYSVVLFIMGTLFPPLGELSALLFADKGGAEYQSITSCRCTFWNREGLLVESATNNMWLYSWYAYHVCDTPLSRGSST